MSQFKDREELDSSLRAANDTLQNELTARLVEAMTEKCFTQCVTQPSDYLTNKEERCMQVHTHSSPPSATLQLSPSPLTPPSPHAV